MSYRSFGTRRFFVLSPFIIALTACGGGGGGSTTITPNDQDAPSVIGVSPADGATNVSTKTAATATFDEDIYGQSLDGSALTLEIGDTRFGGDVAIGDNTNQVTLKPFEKLPPLSDIKATVTRKVTDLSGNRLASDKTWTFSTADGSWTDKASDRRTDTVKDVQIVSDANGNATVIWIEKNDTGPRVEASRYTPEGGWGDAEGVAQYEDSEVDNVLDTALSINSKGTVLAAWRVENDLHEIAANRYIEGNWESNAAPAITDKTVGAEVKSPDVAIEDGGNGVAVWPEDDGSGQYIIKANRFDKDATPAPETESRWGKDRLLGSNDGSTINSTDPRVVVDSSGSALAVWRRGPRIVGVSFSADLADLNSVSVDNIDDGTGAAVSAPGLVVNASGNGVAIWSQDDVIMANRYDAGAWQGSKAIGSGVFGNAAEPSVAVNADGDTLAVWQVDGKAIYASQFNDSSWGSAVKISSDNAPHEVRNPQVALDANGNALAVWRQTDDAIGPQNVVASRLVAGESWSEPEAIESEGGKATMPKVTIDGNGNGTAAWVQVDASNPSDSKIRTNRF